MNKVIITVFGILATFAVMAAGWGSSRIVYGTISGDDGTVGVVTLKLGKKNAKGMAAVSGLMTLSGKKYAIASTKVTAADSVEVNLTVKKLGTAQLTINEDGSYSGSIGDYAIASGLDDGGWSVGDELTFSMMDMPDAIGAYDVLSEFSPGSVTVTVGAKGKLLTPTAGTVKWNNEMESLWCPVKVDGEKVDSENPGALKLKYKASTGKLAGTLKIYTATKSEKKAKAYKFTVSGFVTGGTGSGTVYNKKIGSYAFTLE